MNRLQKAYTEEIKPKIQKELGLENVMEVPRIMKVVVNAGIGPFRENKESVQSFVEELCDITGQKVSERKARKSEAGFKIRKGEVVGYTATLRGERMWAFLDKLISVALPRVRDFRGLNDEAFDEKGNYSLGVKEHVIFPEVNPNKTKGVRSLQLTIVMSSGDKEKNIALLKGLGMPFKKEKN